MSNNEFMSLINLIIKKLEENFGKDTIMSVALFGSVARNTPRKDSDVDMLVLHKPIEENPVKKWGKVLNEILDSSEFNNMVSLGYYPYPTPVFFTPDKLKEKPLILLDIMDHGVILLDRDNALSDLMDRFRSILSSLGSKKIVLEDGSWVWELKPDWKPGEEFEIKL